MIKTILVPASGSSTDEPVFAAALSVGRSLGAHLDFYHIHVSTAEAAPREPHLDFCMGPALRPALTRLERKEEKLCADALAHFRRFCTQNDVPVREAPGITEKVSASWCEQTDRVVERLLRRARHSDLVVLGRPHHVDYMPTLLLEDLLMGSGRPLLIAPDAVPKRSSGTIVVAWKETPEAARALTAAAPLLERARKVVLLHVCEDDTGMQQALDHLVHQLRWHGITAETRIIKDHDRRATAQLTRAADELQADLLVVGGFGRGHVRELVFGGVTQSLVERAGLPVFMMH